jgi:hypothetical protein
MTIFPTLSPASRGAVSGAVRLIEARFLKYLEIWLVRINKWLQEIEGCLNASEENPSRFHFWFSFSLGGGESKRGTAYTASAYGKNHLATT